MTISFPQVHGDIVLSRPGIQRPTGPGTDRFESVQDFKNFVDLGPVRDRALSRSWSGPVLSSEIFRGPGPVTGFEIWFGITKIYPVQVQS